MTNRISRLVAWMLICTACPVGAQSGGVPSWQNTLLGADSLKKEGKTTEALKHYGSLWALCKEKQEEALCVACIQNISDCLAGLNHQKKRKTFLLKAAAFFEPAGCTPIYGSIRKNLGEVYIALEEHKKAVSSLHAAFICFRALQNKEEAAWSAVLLGVNAYHQNNFDRMETHLLEAEKWAGETAEKKNALDATIYQLLAVAYDKQGNFEKGLSVARKALESRISQKNGSPDEQRWLAVNYNNVGNLLIEKGDYSTAETCFKKAIRIHQQQHLKENRQLLSHYYNHLGLCYRESGKDELAWQAFGQAMQCFEKTDEKNEKFEIDLLLNLGAFLRRKGDLKQAATILKRLRVLHASNPYQSEQVLSSIGMWHQKKGHWKAAMDTLQLALKTSTANKGRHHPVTALQHMRIGDLYAAKDQPEPALGSYQKALISLLPKYDAPIGSPPKNRQSSHLQTLLQTLTGKADMLLKKYDKTARPELLLQAFEHYKYGMNVLDNIHKGYAAEHVRRQIIDDAYAIYEGAITAAWLLYETTENSAWLDTTYQVGERSKSRLMLLQNKALYLQDKDKTATKQLDEAYAFQVNLAWYLRNSEEARRADNTLEEQKWNDVYAAEKGRFEAFKMRFQNDFPDWYSLYYQTPILSVDSLQKSLAEEEEVWMYLTGKKRLFIWVITQDKLSLDVRPASPDLPRLLHRYYQQLSHPAATREAVREFQETAHSLYRIVLPYRNKTLPKQLVIIPGGGLHGLPFEALITEKQKNHGFRDLNYLGNDCRVSYGLSATLLNEWKQKSSALSELNLLAVAPDPIAGMGQITQHIPEAAAICSMFGGTHLKNHQATKKRFIEALQTHNIIHIASHAQANLNHPERSLIRFTPAADTSDNGALYASEIYGLEMQTRMVVLSACETGYGDLSKGEGRMSLARAFMYRGTPSLLTSLWKVDDRSTFGLMASFYQSVEKGKALNDALHQAQQEYLLQADDVLAHPYYWSGFVLLGSTSKIVKPQRDTNWILWGVVVLGGLVLTVRFKKPFSGAILGDVGVKKGEKNSDRS